MLPDPADLAWMHDARRERAHQRWLAEHRGKIEELRAKLIEAHALSRRIWPGAEDDAPAAILNALYAVESELEG